MSALLLDMLHTVSMTRTAQATANSSLATQRLTSRALRLISGLGSKVSSLSPARSGNQKYTCSSRSTNFIVVFSLSAEVLVVAPAAAEVAVACWFGRALLILRLNC